MPLKDPEERKAYEKERYEKNKEKRKEYLEQNKEKNKEKAKEYYETNKEKIKEKQKEYKKEYRHTEPCKKTARISRWKRIGLKCDDIDSLYEHYINCKNCEVCNIELVEGNFGANKRCLDHDHKTGLFRNVLCNSCNIRRG